MVTGCKKQTSLRATIFSRNSIKDFETELFLPKKKHKTAEPEHCQYFALFSVSSKEDYYNVTVDYGKILHIHGKKKSFVRSNRTIFERDCHIKL